MATPIVSVITPCYNDGHFLDLPLRAIREQTFRDYEQIIVNDGSTDSATLNRLAVIDDPQVRVIHQENKGLPGARNAGIAVARGRYILPLDADDALYPHALESYVAEIERHPEVAVVYANVQLFGLDDRVLVVPQFDPYRILFANHVPVCSLFRRRAWEHVGGYTEVLRAYEDWEFWIKLSEAGFAFRRIDDVLNLYNVHEGSMIFRVRAQWKSLVADIRRRHPMAYRPENLRRLRHEHGITWFEALIYRMPPPWRFALRRRFGRFLVPVGNALGLWRDA